MAIILRTLYQREANNRLREEVDQSALSAGAKDLEVSLATLQDQRDKLHSSNESLPGVGSILPC